MSKMLGFFKSLFTKFNSFSLPVKIILILVFIGFGWFLYGTMSKKTPKTTYQTSQVTRGTLIVAVTGSGQVSTANNSTITTGASGVVSDVYVTDGTEVKMGDKIADIDLDMQGKQAADQAYASYQSAKNNLENARIAMYTTQSDMFTNWKSFYDLATNSTYTNSDGSPNETNRALAEFHIANNGWLATEAKYKNQQNVVNQAQTSLNSAWLAYQQSSGTVYAPISGTVTGLSLQVGSVITQTTSTTTAQSSTKIASIKTKAMPSVSVNLTEIDVPKVKIGDRATVTFDSQPDKTFTGKVISIDTAGTVSSGVTTYPTVIRLDTDAETILPNMAASASIITATKDNVLMIPSSGIQTDANGDQTVRVLKKGAIQTVSIQTGLSSDTQTEVTGGLSENDTVVTSVTQAATSTGATTSPFSMFGGGIRTGNVRRN